MINEKKQMLLRFLDKDNWKTSFEISKSLGFSVRLVKKYISELNSEFSGIIETSRQGFRLSSNLNNYSIQEAFSNEVPTGHQQRRNYIYEQLLLKNELVRINYLCETLFISDSTLNHDLSVIKNELNDYNLILRIKDGYLKLEGPEIQKKKLLSKIIFSEASSKFLTLESIQHFFPNYDIKILKHIILQIITDYDYFLDDYSMFNFILHIVIRLNRSNKFDSTDELMNKIAIPTCIEEIITKICKKIYEYYPNNMTKNDQYDLSLLLMSRIISKKENEINISKLPEIIDEETLLLLSKIQVCVKNTFSIDLSNPDFVIRFALHLKNLTFRLKNEIVVHNPEMMDIKKNYPFIYDISVFIADIVYKEFGKKPSEDEIAFFSLHMGVLIDEQNDFNSKLKCVLLIPRNNISDNRIIKKVFHIFDDELIISDIISFPDELYECDTFDLLISTMDVDTRGSYAFVKIGYFFDNEDIQNIYNEIQNIHKQKEKIEISDYIRQVFGKENFSIINSHVTRDEVLSLMCKKLYDSGYVPSNFIDKIHEREEISSSAYGKIALPHPINMIGYKTTVAVAICTQPIIWNDNKVDMIFMLSLNKDDGIKVKELFNIVYEAVDSVPVYKRMLECKSYEEFVSILVEK